MADHTTIQHLYLDPDIAASTLHRRRGYGVSAVNVLEERLQSRPHAVLLRSVMTPNFETARFVNLARHLGLQPIILEYLDDQFTARNPLKAALATMRFGESPSSPAKGELDLLAPATTSGQSIRALKTFSGQSLAGFHHRLSSASGLAVQADRMDASSWVREHGGTAPAYYRDLFLLFVRHGVLFESFLLKGQESAFTQNVVLPAWEEAMRQKGRPLVCRLDPEDSEGSESWTHYPLSLRSAASAEMLTAAA